MGWTNEQRRAAYASNPAYRAKVREATRRWRAANPEKVAEQKRRAHTKCSQYQRMKAADPERLAAMQARKNEARRAARIANPQKARSDDARKRARTTKEQKREENRRYWAGLTPEQRKQRGAARKMARKRFYEKNRERLIAKGCILKAQILSREQIPDWLIDAKILELRVKRAIRGFDA